VIGFVLIAHAPLASALAEVAEHVYSREPDVVRTHLRALDVAPDVDVDAAVQQAGDLKAAVDSGKGVLVLTDALGATPGNVATRLADPGRVAVVAGLNLPMLLRALCYRSLELGEVVEKAVAGGVHGVTHVAAVPTRQNQTSYLRGCPPGDDLARIHDQQ